MIEREKVITALECCKDIHQSGRWASGCISCGYSDKHRPDCFLSLADDAVELLKEQDDSIRILISDLEDLRKEHEKLLDKKIPLITNGQEVVRCKDCKWYDERFSICDDCGLPREQTFFCADGKRKNEDD